MKVEKFRIKHVVIAYYPDGETDYNVVEEYTIRCTYDEALSSAKGGYSKEYRATMECTHSGAGVEGYEGAPTACFSPKTGKDIDCSKVKDLSKVTYQVEGFDIYWS